MERRVGAVATHVAGKETPPIDGLIKVRAITNFLVLTPDQSQWAGLVQQATGVATALVARYTQLGYETQTLRIVTNPFGEYLDCSSIETALAGLAAVKAILDADSSGIRIRFAIGAARTAAELALVPRMIAAYGDLCNICVNVEADEAGLVDAHMCDLAAECVRELATETDRCVRLLLCLGYATVRLPR